MTVNPPTAWVATLPPQLADRAAPIRLDAEVMAAFDEGSDVVWMRGESLTQSVQSLPFLELYRIDETGRLYPLSATLPVRRLPETLEWVPLAELILPHARTPLYLTGEIGNTAPLRIVRGGAAEPPNLLRLPLESWRDYAATAPEIRLRPLTFAASATEVIIRGTPLPPIPSGEVWTERDGIALRTGFRCEPAISPAILKRVLSLMTGELALISESGIVERISAENFIPATRGAARLTAS